jgi:hypothetical protein
MRGCFVTLLIVLLSVTNIILGFGLAIYLGRARAPWATGERTTSYRPPASGEKSHQSPDDFTETSGQENEEKSDAEIAGAIEEDASDETPEVSAEQEVLDSVETIREEIHEQPELQTANDTS